MLKSRLLHSLAICTAFIFYSCQSANQSLNKTWFFEYYSNAGQGSGSLNPENFIDLRKDGSYTSYLSKFEYGTWKKEDRGIRLVNQKGESRFLKIMSLNGEELTLDLSQILKDETTAVFTGLSNKNVKEVDNPFSKENNQWRIKPARPESSEQIKNRLINHFRYWEKYFQWAVDNDLKTIGVGSMDSPIKIYGNGFGLIPYNDLSKEWKENFFDEGDCITAWDKLKTMMDTKNVSWPKTANRYKFFIAGFQQLQMMVE